MYVIQIRAKMCIENKYIKNISTYELERNFLFYISVYFLNSLKYLLINIFTKL